MDNTLIKRSMRHIGALVAVAALSGCASGSGKFACPAQSTGYGCKSTLEVYEITSRPGVYDARAKTAPTRTARRDRATRARTINTHGVGITEQAMALQAPVQQDMGAFIAPASLSLGPAPTAHMAHDSDAVARLPAQVMRIWVAPWTDERGDLHRPSHIYTEIVARRWAVGGDVRPDEGVQASFDPNGPMFPKTTP